MKKSYKVYSKPDIIFEDFAMTTSISSCDVKAGFYSGDCGVQLTPFIFVFTEDANGCNAKYKDGEYNSICYHVPYDGNQVFGS